MNRLLRCLAAGAIVATLAGCSMDDNYTTRVHDRSQATQAQAQAQGLQAQADAVKAQAQAQENMFATLADAASANTVPLVATIVAGLALAGYVIKWLLANQATQAQALTAMASRALDVAERVATQAPASRPGYLPAPAQVEPRGYLHTDPGAPLVPASIREYAEQVGGVIVFYPDRGWRIVVPSTGRVIRPRLITQETNQDFTE